VSVYVHGARAGGPAPCHVHQPGDRLSRPHRGRTDQDRFMSRQRS